MPQKYTITTPIYYVNSLPHLGTALTTFASDVTSRYEKMRGNQPYFVTGTDENAIKVMEAAEKQGKSPQQLVDEITEEFKKLWKGMKIEYHDFIRTTEPRHKEAVYKLFEILKSKNYIYLGKYEGWYDVSSETFYKEADLIDGKSPDGNPVRWVEEENWFFKLSAFEDQILSHIEKNPEFILPIARKNEVVSFIKQGLRDVCITRQNQSWGIPVPDDENRVFYVWFEALINYIASCDWPNPGWEEKWPAEVQWMGKDILTRFHATLWPAMLMGAEIPLPKTLVGHGWLLVGGEKASKSKGNVIHPFNLAKELQSWTDCEFELAIDAIRHYIGAIMPYETDFTFTYEDFERRYNSDLANDLGNALNRTLAMCHKFTEGIVADQPVDQETIDIIQKAKSSYEKAMASFRIDRATEASMSIVKFLNKYIDDKAPWALAKNKDPKLGSVLRSMLTMLRATEGLIRPIQPEAANKIAEQLKLEPLTDWSEISNPEIIPTNHQLGHPKPIYPRIDQKKKQESKMTEKPKQEDKLETKEETKEEYIGFEDFKKVKLQVGTVTEVEDIPKSKKLLKFQIDVGGERRQILGGYKGFYTPEELVGKQVIITANLKPAKLMGIESQGMILAAVGADGEPILLQTDKEVAAGSSVE